MNAKHTPGPWTAERMRIAPKEKDRRCGFVINGPDAGDSDPLPTRICDLRVPRGIEGFREGEANARLIAAAPDLLEACKALLQMAYPTVGQEMSYQTSQDIQAHRQVIRAAIEKATGTP